MARTTADAVKRIILVDSDQVSDLSPFIETANNIVTRVCVTDPLTQQPTGYQDGTLELIERWLTAHFYAIRDPRLASENFGGASSSFQGQTAFNFQGTSYGQQALLLDINGGLAWLSKHIADGKRGKIGVTSLASHRRGGFNWEGFLDRP